MPDAPTSAEELFSHARPVLVVPEASTEGALAPAVTAEYSLGKLAAMDVTMSSRFEDQWVTKYLTRIFPWALNYSCGGPEYPHLFANWKPHA